MKTGLRTLLLSFILFSATLSSSAQYVAIPDSNFGTWLNSNGYSQCMQGNNSVGWQMDTTCNAVVSAGAINCAYWHISSLEGIQYFDSLRSLFCHNNTLYVLPPLPKSLIQLYCHTSYLSSLPILPSSLQELVCYGSYLSSLPTLPNSLTKLNCYWNQLTSLPTLPNSLTYLNCGYNQLTNLPSLPGSLTYLDCSYNQLTNLASPPGSLSSFNCSNNQLISLPALPSSLPSIDCSHNQLTSLPALPSSLISLYCSYNQLTSLPALPSSLPSIDCSHNQLTSLPALPSSLISLTCSDNLLTSLPTSFNSNLQTIICANNQLTSLQTLPSSLISLYCWGNQLSSLPALPGMMKALFCHDNQLSSLPALPGSLINLRCSNNQLNTLPALPGSLKWLNCDTNQLSSIPALPGSMETLICNKNNLSSLPALPTIFKTLSCCYNQLTTLPELSDSIAFLNCSYNPSLTCFPVLKKITNFYFHNTGVTCLPNYPQSNAYSQPSLSSVPLCDTSSFNFHRCGSYWNIAGKIYDEKNPNCVYDLGENVYSNIKVQLYDNGVLKQQIFNNTDGSYSINTDLSVYQYSIDSSNIPFTVSCPAVGYRTSNITAIDSTYYGMDFGLSCKQGFDIGATSVEGRFRPGDISDVNITAGDVTNYFHAHCATGVSGVVTVTITGSAHYIAPTIDALTPVVNGNTLIYTINNFDSIDFFHAFNIMVQTDTTAVLGSQICFNVTVTPVSGDNNPSNNTLSNCFTVVGSFDPNDKTAYPAGNIDTATKEITYTIRFQNTGTAEAQHIYITDTLDSDIDERSFQLLAYSHQPMVQIEQNRVRFNFPNINLPDSNTNEPLSHGYVQYKVKLKDNLPIGTVIDNTAFIYFDFNAPVVTNTARNTISTNTGLGAATIDVLPFSIYPNPANGSFTVSVPRKLIGELLTVKDMTGRTVTSTILQSSYTKLETANWANGIYLVTIGNSVQKLIVQQ